MSGFHIALFNHGVLQGGVDSLVPEEALELFDRHAFVDRHCRESSPEFMRVNFRNIETLSEFAEALFDSSDSYSFVRGAKGYE